ncbi:MAG: DUF362 domain-containing protein [Pseudomonadota bacterium]
MIPIPLPGGLEMPMPRMVRARQSFNGDTITDVDQAMADQMARFSHIDLTGKSVAVAVGSRGIRSQPPVVKALVTELQKAGAEPFIVPAMGSHGGGTAEGQAAIVEEYNCGSQALGIPLKSSMEVVELCEVHDGLKVYCDKNAMAADYIVPVNRVKPHTSFRGNHESGLCKMLAIGLGKHTGAVEMHRRGMVNFGPILPKVAEGVMANASILFACAIVENGYEKLHTMELVAPGDIIERDAELLVLSKNLIPRLLVDPIDVLIVDEIGKNISGAGMDPNVTGRNSQKMNDFGGPDINRIIVRGLTEGTHGNATGLGVADVTTQAVVKEMDWTKTYVNIVTSGEPGAASLPLVANNDLEAISLAMRGVIMLEGKDARIVRIENTLDLADIWVSEPMIGDVEKTPGIEIVGEPFDMPMTSGMLGALHG